MPGSGRRRRHARLALGILAQVFNTRGARRIHFSSFEKTKTLWWVFFCFFWRVVSYEKSEGPGKISTFLFQARHRRGGREAGQDRRPTTVAICNSVVSSPIRILDSPTESHSPWLFRTLSIVLTRHRLNHSQTPTELQIATVVGGRPNSTRPSRSRKRSRRACPRPQPSQRAKSSAPYSWPRLRRSLESRRKTRRTKDEEEKVSRKPLLLRLARLSRAKSRGMRT